MAPADSSTSAGAARSATVPLGSGLTASVTLDVWRVPARDVPRAMASGTGWVRARRRRREVRFAKLLGTGDERFSPRAADLTRWAVLTAWQDGPRLDADAAPGDPVDADLPVEPAPAWARHATSHWHARLAPLTGRGRWSGHEPFLLPDREVARRWRGPVLAVTRARLRPRRALTFWRAVPPVARALAGTDGLLATFGMGEAPLGVQGTVSLWRDAAALQAFAYGDPAHRAVVGRTRTVGWYAEEMFARFAVVATSGSLTRPSDPTGRTDLTSRAGPDGARR